MTWDPKFGPPPHMVMVYGAPPAPDTFAPAVDEPAPEPAAPEFPSLTTSAVRPELLTAMGEVVKAIQSLTDTEKQTVLKALGLLIDGVAPLQAEIDIKELQVVFHELAWLYAFDTLGGQAVKNGPIPEPQPHAGSSWRELLDRASNVLPLLLAIKPRCTCLPGSISHQQTCPRWVMPF